MLEYILSINLFVLNDTSGIQINLAAAALCRLGIYKTDLDASQS